MNAQLPPPIPRLDPARLIDALATRHRIHLDLIGTASEGAVGAAFVRWPDGRDGVLGTVGDASPETGHRLGRTAEVLRLARARGVPVPSYDLIVPVDGTHVVVQERLPGRPPGAADATLIDRMIMVTEPWAGLLARFEAEPASLHLTESGPGFCVHESLERYDPRTRRLLGQVREIGRAGPNLIMGDDLVHLDYHPGNILVDDTGVITGIIDWDAAARGDRWFSLEVLSQFLIRSGRALATQRRLRDLIEAAAPPERLRSYRAHLALRQVDWVIRHNGPADVDFWLGVAQKRLDQ